VIDVELALAASSRLWSEQLHRFLIDHGGARVRTHVISGDDALAEAYHVLVIDDICSFLTPRLVDEVQRRGRFVLGVYEREEAGPARNRLLGLGVDGVIEAESEPEDFLEVIERFSIPAIPPETPPRRLEPRSSDGVVIAVGSPPGGCGASELAIALGGRLAESHGPTVVVDADEVAPSLAQRLALARHPNLRTAIDVVEHHSGSLRSCLQRVGRMDLLAGLAGPDDWREVRPSELVAVIDRLLGAGVRFVIANIGFQIEGADRGRHGLSRAAIGRADMLVAVCLAHPVAVSRVVGWAGAVRAIRPDLPIQFVVNRAPASRHRRAEIEEELTRADKAAGVCFLPDDSAVAQAAWSGLAVRRGRFRRAASKLADRMVAA
jgi:MinD-like ATPase involved in chromosome partitioning or flagellar assembly